MSQHSVVEAKNNLSDLIARADLDWLDANRITPQHGSIDAATLVRQMRDEGY